MLVHGAWTDGSSWAAVTDQLQREGYTVVVVPNPLRGIDYDSRYLEDYLATIAGPIVLVGHSYAGMVITAAAANNFGVSALVYVPGTGICGKGGRAAPVDDFASAHGRRSHRRRRPRELVGRRPRQGCGANALNRIGPPIIGGVSSGRVSLPQP
ncbi:triacylglycerol lipase [Actinoplanes sp. TBRC 11911]|uniref:esterase/lipase family protein n=1 Tax=Actinoplanes sp. TBRC 11911 TaxID=2729386 RepID=UPI001B7D5E01|nr:alpha/beta hydrolase [Actinoplanes sp. TBRC 11911]